MSRFSIANVIHDIGDQPTAMYPRVVTAVLIATGALIVLHLLLNVVLVGVRARRPRWGLLTKLIYLATLASVAALAGTSFYAVIRQGAMHGWLLLAHVVAAGAFVVLLMLTALMWAWPCRFGAAAQRPVSRDFYTSSRARRSRRQRTARLDNDLTDAAAAEADLGHEPAPQRFSPTSKLLFWLILITGVATAGSMLLSMLPLFGTDDMHDLITLHRYSGLGLVVAVILHAYMALLSRMRRL